MNRLMSDLELWKWIRSLYKTFSNNSRKFWICSVICKSYRTT